MPTVRVTENADVFSGYTEFASTCNWVQSVFNWPITFRSPEVVLQVVEEAVL